MIIGVDFDSFKATLVGLPLEGGGGPILNTAVFRKKSGTDEGIEALARVRSGLMELPLCHLGHVYFIERGWGASRRADYLMGAYFGVIFATLSGKATTNVMTAQEWKKRVSAACGVKTRDGSPGRGDLSKEEAHVHVLALAATQGHDVSGYGPDALDAYAIALTGRWLNDEASGMTGGHDEGSGSTSFTDARPGLAPGGVPVLDPGRA